jgi:hypothetical protein
MVQFSSVASATAFPWKQFETQERYSGWQVFKVNCIVLHRQYSSMYWWCSTGKVGFLTLPSHLGGLAAKYHYQRQARMYRTGRHSCPGTPESSSPAMKHNRTIWRVHP